VKRILTKSFGTDRIMPKPFPKSTVFRVSGFPASQSFELITEHLVEFIEGHLKKENEENWLRIKHVEAIPSCYSTRKRIALLTIEEPMPTFLSSLAKDPMSKYQVMLNSKVITFDTNFLGFTQLYKAYEPASSFQAEYAHLYFLNAVFSIQI
jgi:hypothetical protein